MPNRVFYACNVYLWSDKEFAGLCSNYLKSVLSFRMQLPSTMWCFSSEFLLPSTGWGFTAWRILEYSIWLVFDYAYSLAKLKNKSSDRKYYTEDFKTSNTIIGPRSTTSHELIKDFIGFNPEVCQELIKRANVRWINVKRSWQRNQQGNQLMDKV